LALALHPELQTWKMGLSAVNLDYLNIKNNTVHYNLPVPDLVESTLKNNMGKLADSGALMVDTGRFTGRSPKDRFIVKNHITEEAVDWNDINQGFDVAKFNQLYSKMLVHLNQAEHLYVRDVSACANPTYTLNVRVINEAPWQNIFVHNMFIEPSEDRLANFLPDWHVIAAPSFKANPSEDGTRAENFSIIDFEKRVILIGGSAYTGEIKKGIFSVLNFILPKKEGVLPMHCSANMGKDGNTAVFFGLSGTGKTTLSADDSRFLIGDDEHGWSDEGVFNFEGGCYAKTINLSPEGEPEIFGAIKPGALLENVRCYENTNKVDFSNTEVTQNTRVSYPISHIKNALLPSKGGIPKNVFFLTYDAFGVLPPISRLNKDQAMYQFVSGFTSKVAGTEDGVNEPQTTFSACYGAPFLPLHPAEYATMLGNRIQAHDVKVWLVNTGMTGGVYGQGTRMKLSHTRTLINAALDGKLNDVEFETMPVFGFEVPQSCEGVPSSILNPSKTWANKEEYDKTLNMLALSFVANFKQFESKASEGVKQAAPKTLTAAY